VGPEPAAGVLYVVATPIGNLEDITLRALRVLREVDLVAAEDTRRTRGLLAHFEIRARLVAYHAHSGAARVDGLIEQLRAGHSVALVSDAGTPGISDPGAELVAAAVRTGVRVVPVPGPSAVIAALSASGLLPNRFSFEGFPPRPLNERRRFLGALRSDPRTLVLYETPQRLIGTLELVTELFGDRPLVVARELTKQFEELVRGTAAEALARFAAVPPRGECVLVLAGAPPAEQPAVDPARIEERAGEILAGGRSERDTARQVAEEFNVPRRLAYEATLKAAERQ
jgi:16S rRNA (cytidine1402-2'-O)-methyltransferase